MFELIATWVTRRAWLVVLAWLGVAGLLSWIAPPWEDVLQDDSVKFFPDSAISVHGQNLLYRGFPDATPSAAVIIAERPDTPLTDRDRAFVASMSDRFQNLLVPETDPPHPKDWRIREVQDFRTPGVGERLISPVDSERPGQACLTVLTIDAVYQSRQARLTVNHIEEELAKILDEAPEGLNLALTGSAVLGRDINQAALESVDATTGATVLLVIVILLMVYRSPILALIPLLAIALSVYVALKGLPLLLWVPGLEFQVISITKTFVVVVLFGAGTDYCLFLIARYREELARGHGIHSALRVSIRQVGPALAASAGTVIVGLGMLWFSTFAKISYSGPAIALSLVAGLLAALTLAPILLRMLRRTVFWPFAPPHHHLGADPDLEGQAETPMHGVWAWVADRVVRHPGLILATSILILTPFAMLGSRTVSDYGQLSDLPDDTPCKAGANLIRNYFTIGELGPTSLLVQVPGLDFRSPEGREAVASLTKRLEAIEAVAEVRSLTRPLGEPLPEPVAAAADAGGSTFWGRLRTDPLKTLRDQAVRLGAENHYVSTTAPEEVDRNSITRLTLVLGIDPFSEEALRVFDELRAIVADATESGGPMAGAAIGYTGATAEILDLKTVITADQRRMYVLVPIGVYVVLVLLLRRPGISLYLIATVVFSYLVTLGLTDLFFQAIHRGPDPWVGLDWKVGFFLFVILVAIGEDYNIFLMSRVIEEERGHGPIEATRRAVSHTGGIISSCGLIMAGTFAALASGRLLALKQLGFALSVGILLDTFVVRPILVPAFLVLLQRARRRAPSRASIRPLRSRFWNHTDTTTSAH